MAYVDPSRRFGFTTYADGTPRFDALDDPAIDDDRFGYEDAESDWDDEALEPSDESSTRSGLSAFLAALLAGTLAAAILAYFGTGLVRSMHPKAATPPAAAPVAVTPPAQVLSAPPPAAPVAALPPPAIPHPEATAKPHRSGQKAATHRSLARLDCARPASPAQRMVCHSPTLLADDRRMTRAYAHALAAGAPPRRLRQDQVKWLSAREAAAQRSKYAVASLYNRRIEDLESQPYRACAHASGRASVAGVTHWLLSVPRKIVSPGGRAACG